MPSSRIARLPDGLINQIAAGEVVERPAAVVKELIENSLDAGATRIEVLLQDGGTSSITVIDNGSGIDPEDLPLAVERHATSKISKAEDLEGIMSFGFRGEALSSIAAVARVTLRSRTETMTSAAQLTIDHGTADGETRPVGAPPGTSIVVEGLFDRVPARKKFLKSVATEFTHAAKGFKEVALGNPQSQFFLQHQGTLLHKFVASDRLGRMREVCRPQWDPIHVTGENEITRLEAFLSPTHLIQSRGELSLFINQRPVKNRALLQAVRSAYLDTLGAHHEPSGVVYLDIRWDHVDVNVHPQKSEVRCLRQEALYPWLVSTIRKAITAQNTPREVRLPEPVIFSPAPVELHEERISEPLPPREIYRPQALPLADPDPAPTRQLRPDLRYLGQVKAAYLVCEDREGVVLVDQHALHEKLRFEKLRQDFQDGPLNVQRMLLPLVIRLPSQDAALLQDNLAVFHQMGFELEPFGDGDVAVKTRPALLEESKVEEVLKDSLRRLADSTGMPGEKEGLSPALHRLFATLACHSVVRAGQNLSPMEAESLLGQLDRLEQGWTCPHGRPVLFRIPFGSIEKHFERT